MMKNKKADFNVVMMMIILIVCAIILFAIGSKIFKSYTVSGAINSCRLSVLTEAQTKVLPTWNGDKSPFSISCDKRYVTFYNNKVELGLAPEKSDPMTVTFNGKKTTTFSKLDNYIVNQVIAEEMRICYFEFGEGKLHVFDNDLNPKITNIYSGQDVCFVCSEINFQDVPQDTYGGFLDYINRTYIANEKMTYLQYFDQPSISSVKWSVYMSTIMDDKTTFDSTQKYAVVFGKQDKRFGTILLTIGDRALKGAAGGAVLGAAVSFWGFGVLAAPGAAMGFVSGALWGSVETLIKNNQFKNNYYVFIVPATKLNGMCDIMPT